MFRTLLLLGVIAFARAGGVTVLTEKDFDTTVYDSGKSVFVRAASLLASIPRACAHPNPSLPT